MALFSKTNKLVHGDSISLSEQRSLIRASLLMLVTSKTHKTQPCVCRKVSLLKVRTQTRPNTSLGKKELRHGKSSFLQSRGID